MTWGQDEQPHLDDAALSRLKKKQHAAHNLQGTSATFPPGTTVLNGGGATLTVARQLAG
jgi:hypothetical protein